MNLTSPAIGSDSPDPWRKLQGCRRQLAQQGHRPWPIPAGRWVMLHTWEDLLFLHWPMALESIRRLIPPTVEIDLFEGQAWIGVVPFRIRRLRLRGMPPLPPSRFVELNVRTYVTCNGRPGVWFLSLDASSRLAVCLARAWYRLPYFAACMCMDRRDETIDFSAVRSCRGANGVRAEFRCRYRPAREPDGEIPSPLATWLTERYCLYTSDRAGRLLTAEIHHVPWPLQRVDVSLECNEMLGPLGLPKPECEPLAHFSRRLDAIIWPPTVVRQGDHMPAPRRIMACCGSDASR